MVYLGSDLLLLHRPAAGGAHALVQLRRAPASVGFDAPLRRGVHKRLAGSNLAYMGDGLLLATNGASGQYAFWLVASAANASGAGAAAAAAAGADGLLLHHVSGGVWPEAVHGVSFVPLMGDRCCGSRRSRAPAAGGTRCSRARGRPSTRAARRTRRLVRGARRRRAAARRAARRGDRGGGAGYGGGLRRGASAARPPRRRAVGRAARPSTARLRFDGRRRAHPPPFLPESHANSTTCDALPLPPLFTGAWPHRAHRLLSVGADTVLDVAPETGEFRLWQCHRAAFEPTAAPPALGAAGVEPSDQTLEKVCSVGAHGSWPLLAQYTQAVWLGPTTDALLLFDAASGRYEAWGLRRADNFWRPRASATALARGAWPALKGRVLVNAGLSTLVAADPKSGDYAFYYFDHSVLTKGGGGGGGVGGLMVAEVARGSLGELPRGALADRCRGFGHHQLTALGDGMLLDLDPASGEYCVLLLSRDALSSRPPLAPVATGNLYRAPCAHDSCADCSQEAGCGWCAETGKCMQGDAHGACGGGCREHWTAGYCAEWPCSHHATCDDCLGSRLCGWCGGTNECMAGSDVAPLLGYCPATWIGDGAGCPKNGDGHAPYRAFGA